MSTETSDAAPAAPQPSTTDATRIIPVLDVEPGMVLVGEFGGRTEITGEVGPSSSMPGCHRVEVEHGALYVDSDGTIEILVGEAPELGGTTTTTEALAAALLRNPGKAVRIEVGDDDASVLETGAFSVFENGGDTVTLFAQTTASAGDEVARQEFLRLAVAALLEECQRGQEGSQRGAASANVQAAASLLGIPTA